MCMYYVVWELRICAGVASAAGCGEEVLFSDYVPLWFFFLFFFSSQISMLMFVWCSLGSFFGIIWWLIPFFFFFFGGIFRDFKQHCDLFINVAFFCRVFGCCWWIWCLVEVWRLKNISWIYMIGLRNRYLHCECVWSWRTLFEYKTLKNPKNTRKIERLREIFDV